MSLAASLHGNAGQLADPLGALLLAVDRLAQNALMGGHGRRRSGVDLILLLRHIILLRKKAIDGSKTLA